MTNTQIVTDDAFIRKEMGDHQLAAWLKSNGWKGEYCTCHNAVEYINHKGDTICLCIYNNQNCTRKTYLNRDYYNG